MNRFQVLISLFLLSTMVIEGTIFLFSVKGALVHLTRKI